MSDETRKSVEHDLAVWLTLNARYFPPPGDNDGRDREWKIKGLASILTDRLVDRYVLVPRERHSLADALTEWYQAPQSNSDPTEN